MDAADKQQIEDDIILLRISYLELIKRVEKLEGIEKVDNGPKKPKNVYTIDEMYFVNEYEYKGKTFANFMVRLEGDETLYTWDRILPIKNPTTAGDLIYCEIDNNKLRNVKSLQNI